MKKRELTSLILIDVLESQLEMLIDSQLTHREKDGALQLLILECENLSLKISDEQFEMNRWKENMFYKHRKTIQYIESVETTLRDMLEEKAVDEVRLECIKMFIEKTEKILGMLDVPPETEVIPF